MTIWFSHSVQAGFGQRSTTVAVNPAAANQDSSSASVMRMMGRVSIMATPYRTGVTETVCRGRRLD